MRAAPNRATPTNSLTRREMVDPATLDLHDDRDDERPAPRPFAEETPELDADFFLDEALIGPFFNACSLDDVGDKPRRIPQQFAARGILDEAAAHDFRITFDAARLAVDRDDRNDDPVLRKMPAIAQHFVDDLARTRCID